MRRFLLAAALAACAAGPVSARLATKQVPALEAARKAVAAAEAEAARNGRPCVVAAVDDGGWPLALERMDGAPTLASVELAPAKARAAAAFRKPTQALEDAANKGRFAQVTAPGFTQMQGGVPVRWSSGARWSGRSASRPTPRPTTGRSRKPGRGPSPPDRPRTGAGPRRTPGRGAA